MDGSYRGVVQDGKVVFLEQGPPLKNGTEVFVTLRVPETAPAVAVALDVPPEWVEEVQRLKAEGKRATLPPEVLEQFRNEVSAEEVLAGVEKLKTEGGRQLHEFFDRLKKAAGIHD